RAAHAARRERPDRPAPARRRMRCAGCRDSRCWGAWTARESRRWGRIPAASNQPLAGIENSDSDRAASAQAGRRLAQLAVQESIAPEAFAAEDSAREPSTPLLKTIN